MQTTKDKNTDTTSKGRPLMNLIWPAAERFSIKDIVAAQTGIAAGTINGKIAKAVKNGVIVKVGVQKLPSGKGRPYTIFSVKSS